MKILAFADVHGNRRILYKLVENTKLHKPDFLVCAGDISNFGWGLEKLIRNLDLGIPILVVHGNHETLEEIAQLSKKFEFLINLHGGVFEKEQILFMGCGGGGFALEHEEFEKMRGFFEREIKNHQKKSVLITHIPPRDTRLDEVSFGHHIGDEAVREFIEKNQPDLLICGHVHECAGRSDQIGKTIIINPGPGGKIIEI